MSFSLVEVLLNFKLNTAADPGLYMILAIFFLEIAGDLKLLTDFDVTRSSPQSWSVITSVGGDTECQHCKTNETDFIFHIFNLLFLIRGSRRNLSFNSPFFHECTVRTLQY